jgi:hypothetical protein
MAGLAVTINGRLRLEPSVEIHRSPAAQCADQQAAVTRMSLFAIDPRIRQSGLGWINLGIFYISWRLLDFGATAPWINPLYVFAWTPSRPAFSDEALLINLGLPYLALALAAIVAARPSDPSRTRLWALGLRKTVIKWYVIPIVVAIVLLIALLFASWLVDTASSAPWQLFDRLAIESPAVDIVFALHIVLLLLMAVASVVSIYGIVLPSLLNQLRPIWAYVITSLIGFTMANPTSYLPITSFVVFGPLLMFGCWIAARGGSVLPLIVIAISGLAPSLLVLEAW